MGNVTIKETINIPEEISKYIRSKEKYEVANHEGTYLRGILGLMIYQYYIIYEMLVLVGGDGEKREDIYPQELGCVNLI